MIERVDIIISTKNRIKELDFTIEKMCSIGFSQEQFHIIDDASTDGTFDFVKQKYLGVNITKNIEPKGYMINRSEMMQNSKRDFILSLDDDSHIRSKEDVEEALAVLLSDRSFGIFHFHVFNQISEPTEKCKLSNTVYKVKSYIGCGHIIKREVIQKTGTYFNELGFYEEEMDFSLRAFKYGYYVVTNESLVVHHRIDQKIRVSQKNNLNDKGIYGHYWRILMHSSNILIIPIIHYPLLWDIFFFIKRLIVVFNRTVIIEKKVNLFFSVANRFFSLRKEMLKRVDKLNYSQFREWKKLSFYPSKSN